MTLDAWTIIGTGVALAVLITYLSTWLRSDMKEGHRTLEERLRAVEREQARVAGLLEGPGLTGRATPTTQPSADRPSTAGASLGLLRLFKGRIRGTPR